MPHTFEIHLEHPAPYLLEMLTHTATMPLPRHVVEDKGPGLDASRAPMSAMAPFVLKEWIPNGMFWWKKIRASMMPPTLQLKQIIFYPTDDYGAALQRFRAGELDLQDRSRTPVSTGSGRICRNFFIPFGIESPTIIDFNHKPQAV